MKDSEGTNLCDICPKPGQCCRSFVLHLNGEAFGEVETATQANVQMAIRGFPFLATGKVEGYANFSFMCPMLGMDGRCTIYENRPMTCRIYKPASDPMCVFYEEKAKE